ncbi:hypothetical protein A8B79_11670 [Balneola sp. EhC07]|jgi:DNA-binding NarL/FixJ family response regulator|uniref:response regulator n=1 Tax=Balneola sp. EhC07 TaxID=1849360 RepID=UPI0007F4EFA1|nr:response regulator transcription factor [Balneola sp. EhC07]OAN59630.1 hypothetical protein A8B79_11670 [Balneola sp. EhC07]
MKIMIVDDHASMRKLIKTIVLFSCKEVVECIEYENGEDAVANYMTVKPDYILMDVEMGKMSGFEATKLILKQNNKAKIVIVTGNDARLSRENAKKVGAIGFVSKDNLSGIKEYLKF